MGRRLRGLRVIIEGNLDEKLMEWVKDFEEGRLTPMHRPQDEQQQG
jgi:hypothetical protein